MTRINLIDPHELTDQHLVAEYREIFMIGPALQRTIHSKRGLDLNRIPKKFTLNTGHVLHFYDKGLYLFNRYQDLRREMVKRGMKPDITRHFNVSHWPRELFNDWAPTEDDMNVVRCRIQKRISQRPGWYRHNGKTLFSSS